MHIKYRAISIVVILFVAAGCLPSYENDIFEFKFDHDITKAEVIAKRVFDHLPESNIYPYKPKAGCIIKDSGRNQIFLCIDNNILKFGAALSPGKIEKNRADFISLIDTFKNELTAEKIKFSEKYERDLDVAIIKQLDLYQ